MRRIFRMVFVGAALVAFGAAAATADPKINADGRGVMLHGYDPVAYFSDGPTPGDARWTAEHEGATYRFASAANRDAFIADPARYAPKFGGYCSFGVRMGRKFDIDPTAFHIVDGELYVQLNHATRRRWLEDAEENIAIGQTIWRDIAETPAGALQ